MGQRSVAVLGVAVFAGGGDELELGGEFAGVGFAGGEEAFEELCLGLGVAEHGGEVGGLAAGVGRVLHVAVEVGEAAGFGGGDEVGA